MPEEHLSDLTVRIDVSVLAARPKVAKHIRNLLSKYKMTTQEVTQQYADTFLMVSKEEHPRLMLTIATKILSTMILLTSDGFVDLVTVQVTEKPPKELPKTL